MIKRISVFYNGLFTYLFGRIKAGQYNYSSEKARLLQHELNISSGAAYPATIVLVERKLEAFLVCNMIRNMGLT